jgi:hypothetical protein
MDLFIEERQSRQHLEKYVIQLNQRMTEMAKEVASTKTKVGVLEKTPSNVNLQKAFRALKNSSEIMKQSYDALLLEHSNLKREDNVVTQRHNQLQIDVDSLKQLKTIVPLQCLARKQDFIALMNVTISDTQLTLYQKFKDIEIKQSLTETLDHEFESEMDKIKQTLTAKANGIENRLNTNIRNFTVTSQAIMAILTENNRRGKYII